MRFGIGMWDIGCGIGMWGRMLNVGLECEIWDWDVGIWIWDGYGMGYWEMGYGWDGLWIWDGLGMDMGSQNHRIAQVGKSFKIIKSNHSPTVKSVQPCFGLCDVCKG